MMEVGRGGMTDTEMRSHFALWAMMAAPLIAGNDIRSHVAATQTILKNQNLIAINQDSLGLQATQVSNDGTRRVLAKRLANGDVAVALFNQGGSTTTITTTAAAIGMSGSSFTPARRLDQRAPRPPPARSRRSVPAHGTVVYRVSGGGTDDPPPADHVRAASARRPAGAWTSNSASSQRHPGGDLGLQRRSQPAVDRQSAGELRVYGKVPGRQRRTAPPTAPACIIWDCNGETTSSGASTPTAPSPPSARTVPGRQRQRHRQRHLLRLDLHRRRNQRWTRR